MRRPYSRILPVLALTCFYLAGVGIHNGSIYWAIAALIMGLGFMGEWLDSE